MNWAMCNVVWYDGKDAFVSKHILRVQIGVFEITEESRQLLEEEISGNGEILKVDILYPVDFDDILALAGDVEPERVEEHRALERFKDMWF